MGLDEIIFSDILAQMQPYLPQNIKQPHRSWMFNV